MKGMIENDPNGLGQLESTHHPKTAHLWLIPLIATGPLLMVLLAVFLAVTDLRQGSEKALSGVSNYFICLGLLGILVAVLGAVWLSDFRQWRESKTVRLKIYQNGFSYERDGQIEICRWDEIEKISYGKIYRSSKAFRRWVNVIRSMTIKDGKTIKLPETLELERITEIITARKKDV